MQFRIYNLLSLLRHYEHEVNNISTNSREVMVDFVQFKQILNEDTIGVADDNEIEVVFSSKRFK